MKKALRLLIIEDVEDHALLLVRELGKSGFEPDFVRVEAPQELEAALDTGPWDAVISDYNLPGFNGLDALRIVQAKDLDLPFILVSGVIGEEMAVESLKTGAHDFILKSNLARLGPALVRELREAAIRHERRQTAEELTHHREHLEEMVQQRTEDLAAANEELQAQSEELVSSMDELQRVEQELRASHGRINNILEQMSDGFASFDHDWRYTHINAAAAKAFQMAPEALLGKTIWEMWPTAYDLPLGVNFRRSLQENIPIQFETYYPAPLERWFECRCHPTTEGLATFFSDITERKLAEQAIERLNTDLAERAVELEVVNQDLEAFNHTVAHDLRQPLTVISGFCQAIETICGDQLQEECKGYVREAYNGTLRMNSIIDALLKFSRMSRVEPRLETVDLSALAHKVATELKQTGPGRQVDFRIADGITANADAALLRAVLDNLLGNAWKYTGKRKEALIEVGATEFAGQQVYFVRDNGAGFDKEDADKLFIPFQRLPGAVEFKGFGIGLATAERIIRRHGGKIWAEGEPDKGATFFFMLNLSVQGDKP